MSHKDEAVKAIGGMGDGRNFATDGGLLPLIHATLALVEAQEAATEQARIANLIALLEPDDPREFNTWPDIAQALGIQEEANAD